MFAVRREGYRPYGLLACPLNSAGTDGTDGTVAFLGGEIVFRFERVKMERSVLPCRKRNMKFPQGESVFRLFHLFRLRGERGKNWANNAPKPVRSLPGSGLLRFHLQP